MARNISFDETKNSPISRISLAMSNKQVTKGLVSGSWLDLLCGYNSKLQSSQLENSKIKKFISLDFSLNKQITKKGIVPIETSIDNKLSFPTASFENVTLINGLEHLWNPDEILKECYRILRPNGVLQIIVPTWFSKPILEFITFGLKDSQGSIEIDDHKMYYDEKTLWPMLVKAGFKPHKINLKRIKFYFSLYAKATKQ